ncbi:MAG: hypothetical protein B7Z45_05205 [Azorhizobium sp. 12-66-6]|nr:MAG: hypothetical protein B7Z45_05205 [Azorhizobium sp. 12-66-6]
MICSNDLLALSIIAAVRAMGLSVPGDMSVAGFDGIAIGRLVTPELSTVDQPTRLMGARAIERLFDMFEGATGRAVEHLPYQLRLTGTLAAAPPDPGAAPQFSGSPAGESRAPAV